MPGLVNYQPIRKEKLAFHSRTLPPPVPSISPLPRYYDHFDWTSYPSTASSSSRQDSQVSTEANSWTYGSSVSGMRAAAPVMPPASLYEPSHNTTHYERSAPPGLVHPATTHSFSHLPTAPIVAEMSNDDFFYDEPPQRSHTTSDLQSLQEQEVKPPQDTNNGGVSAHLDYEMDDMTNFVTEQSCKIIFGSSSQAFDFRKFVHHVLTSTRLPSSTLLLAMAYMRHRVEFFWRQRVSAFTDKDLREILTVSLLLASKFLDDNTFQNKSWSEVTRLDVKVINDLEMTWMLDNDWRLGLFNDENRRQWEEWQLMWNGYVSLRKEQERQAEAKLEEERKLKKMLTAIQTQSQPRRPTIPQIRVQPIAYSPDSWLDMYSSQNTPPSAPDSAPVTPELWASSQSNWPRLPAISTSPYGSLPSSAYSTTSMKTSQSALVSLPMVIDPADYGVASHSRNPWCPSGCACKSESYGSTVTYPSSLISNQSQGYQMVTGQA